MSGLNHCIHTCIHTLCELGVVYINLQLSNQLQAYMVSVSYTANILYMVSVPYVAYSDFVLLVKSLGRKTCTFPEFGEPDLSLESQIVCC